MLFQQARLDQQLKALALLECICRRKDANILPQKELGMRPAGCGLATVMLLDVLF
jgi:DNA-binding HxlR family transcriptional regulator